MKIKLSAAARKRLKQRRTLKARLSVTLSGASAVKRQLTLKRG